MVAPFVKLVQVVGTSAAQRDNGGGDLQLMNCLLTSFIINVGHQDVHI